MAFGNTRCRREGALMVERVSSHRIQFGPRPEGDQHISLGVDRDVWPSEQEMCVVRFCACYIVGICTQQGYVGATHCVHTLIASRCGGQSRIKCRTNCCHVKNPWSSKHFVKHSSCGTGVITCDG